MDFTVAFFSRAFELFLLNQFVFALVLNIDPSWFYGWTDVGSRPVCGSENGASERENHRVSNVIYVNYTLRLSNNSYFRDFRV